MEDIRCPKQLFDCQPIRIRGTE